MDGCSVSLSVSSNTGSVVEHCMSILYSPGVRKTTVHSWYAFADSGRDVSTTLKTRMTFCISVHGPCPQCPDPK